MVPCHVEECRQSPKQCVENSAVVVSVFSIIYTPKLLKLPSLAWGMWSSAKFCRHHSLRMASTGFDKAARILCRLTVKIATASAVQAANTKVPQCIVTR